MENRNWNKDVMQNLFNHHRLNHISCVEGKNINQIVAKEQTMEVSKEGWMSMSLHKSMRFKKRYYFMFSGEEQLLRYYIKKNIVCSKGIIEMRHVLKVEKIANNECALRLAIPDQQWFFLCDTETDRDDWHAVFCEYCLYEDGFSNDIEGLNNPQNVHEDVCVNVAEYADIAPIPFVYKYEFECSEGM